MRRKDRRAWSVVRSISGHRAMAASNDSAPSGSRNFAARTDQRRRSMAPRE
ncbi:MAG: hypothetical protein E7K72_26230 [Roseomonas mucosa]|nr:hypothetical protein [Roseomonas mucosa]